MEPRESTQTVCATNFRGALTDVKATQIMTVQTAGLRVAPTAYIPVEAEAVEALLARLVDGVEPGAGILLLSAIWESTETRFHVISLFHINS